MLIYCSPFLPGSPHPHPILSVNDPFPPPHPPGLFQDWVRKAKGIVLAIFFKKIDANELNIKAQKNQFYANITRKNTFLLNIIVNSYIDNYAIKFRQ